MADLDRSLAFYRDCVGFRLDVDVSPAPGVRIVQLTPPGSACSILLAERIPTAETPVGSVRGLHLVTSDVSAARASWPLVGLRSERSKMPNAGSGWCSTVSWCPAT
ncbi:VOC family protein [Mycobacterium sp. 1423905.2]|uniref:VOC family protein n=1 Tax=Mycobacterium sp. 1423905.2 TaxID=1856859 RepID=UPI0020A544A6|nr:VOC family protein [Mycobacterium sp. 1423905.2]